MTYFRKIIHISGEDSPNVLLARLQQQQGIEPTGEQVIPGVLPWDLFQHRLATWDKVRICIGVYGHFYEGGEVLLYPPDWLNLSEQRAATLATLNKPRKAKAIGVDTAEGGDDTCWAVCDELGLIELISQKTPDTSIIPNKTIALINQYGVKPNMVMFDRGGGGFEHACTLKERGYAVQSIGFGEAIQPEPVRYTKEWEQAQDERREKYAYRNRRAQMYFQLRLAIEPSINTDKNGTYVGFAIPAEYRELRRQLAPMPLWYDEEGRIIMPPKKKRSGLVTETRVKTIEDMIGCSPDQADALVLAVHAMSPAASPIVIKPMF